MKKLLALIFLLSCSIFSFSQSWVPVFNGIDSGGGAMDTLNGKLYIVGNFANNNKIATWDGTHLDTISSHSNGIVATIASYNNNLYADGVFRSISGISASNIARWNGSTWNALGSGLNSSCFAFAQCIYNGELYVTGGGIDSAGGKDALGIARWNGTSWDSVGQGLFSLGECMTVYNGNLYVGGMFEAAAAGVNAENIAQWDGTVWDTVGWGSTIQVNTMQAYNGKLYASGRFYLGSGLFATGIGTWDATKWDSLNSGKNFNGWISAMTVYNGLLIVGGTFDSVAGILVHNIAAWDGSHWSAIGSGFNNYVSSLCVYDGKLYAGGYFDSTGNTPLNHIAVWNGPLGVQELSSKKETVKVYPDPSTGIFTFQVKSEELRSKSTLEVYNMLGEKVCTQFNIHNSTFSIDLSNQPSGVYLYRITSEQGDDLGTGRIVIK
jgi:hypothetical protein